MRVSLDTAAPPPIGRRNREWPVAALEALLSANPTLAGALELATQEEPTVFVLEGGDEPTRHLEWEAAEWGGDTDAPYAGQVFDCLARVLIRQLGPAPGPQPLREPPRVLFAASSFSDGHRDVPSPTPRVQGIRGGLDPALRRGLATLTEDPEAARDFATLRAAVGRLRPHVLHLLGHGSPEAGLILSNGEALSPDQLAKVVTSASTLRLLVLEGCHTLPLYEAALRDLDQLGGVIWSPEETPDVPGPLSWAELYHRLAYGAYAEEPLWRSTFAFLRKRMALSVREPEWRLVESPDAAAIGAYRLGVQRTLGEMTGPGRCLRTEGAFIPRRVRLPASGGKARIVPLDDWFPRRTARTLLVANPGSGRSAILRHLACEAAARLEEDPTGRLPLYLHLGRWREADPLEAAAREAGLDPAEMAPETWARLARQLRLAVAQGRALLLIDGAEEAPYAARGPLLQALTRLVGSAAGPLHVLAAARPGGDFGPLRDRLSLGAPVWLVDLSDDDVRRLIRLWVEASGDPTRGSDLAAQLLHPDTRPLARVPYFLRAMVYMAGENGMQPPSSIRALYEGLVEAQIARQARRYVPDRSPAAVVDRVEAALTELAGLLLQSRESVTTRAAIARLRAVAGDPDHIDVWLANSGLLQPGGARQWRFSAATLQDYFAGRWLSEAPVARLNVVIADGACYPRGLEAVRWAGAWLEGSALLAYVEALLALDDQQWRGTGLALRATALAPVDATKAARVRLERRLEELSDRLEGDAQLVAWATAVWNVEPPLLAPALMSPASGGTGASSHAGPGRWGVNPALTLVEAAKAAVADVPPEEWTRPEETP